MSDFTPGPWRIGAIESGMVAIDGANGEEVTGFVFPEDGRLIAAAPDLLDALQQYSIGFTDESAARAEFGDYEVDRELKRRAAIARATGEQP